MRKKFFIAAVTLLVACTPKDRPTDLPDASAINQQINPTSTFSTEIPPIDQTRNPPEEISEDTPESTEVPTSNPSVLDSISGINLPDWVSNPETGVLMVSIGTFDDGFENLSLVDVRTNEQFGFPTLPIDGYFWMPDGQQIGFISLNAREITLLDTATSETSIFELDDISARLSVKPISTDPPLVHKALWFSEVGNGFIVTAEWKNISSDGHYLERPGDYHDEFTEVQDLITGEIEVLTDPSDELYDLFRNWSPVDPNLLAILQSTTQSFPWSYFEVPTTFYLRIIDVQNNKILNSYIDTFGADWSPDGSYILFRQKQQDLRSAPPCVINITLGDVICYQQIFNLHSPGAHLGNYSWSPDGKYISYIYSDTNTEGTYEESGDLCLITRINGYINCYLEDLVPEDHNVIRHKWSPDGQFIVFSYDTSCPGCDYIDWPKIGVLDIENESYFFVTDQVDFSELGLWRPELAN